MSPRILNYRLKWCDTRHRAQVTNSVSIVTHVELSADVNRCRFFFATVRLNTPNRRPQVKVWYLIPELHAGSLNDCLGGQNKTTSDMPHGTGDTREDHAIHLDVPQCQVRMSSRTIPTANIYRPFDKANFCSPGDPPNSNLDR